MSMELERPAGEVAEAQPPSERPGRLRAGSTRGLSHRLGRAGLLIAAVALAAAGCIAQASSGANLGSSSVEQGRQLYQQECTSCHGARGDRIPAAPLSSKEFLESRGDATLAAVIAEGKGVMPAWGKAREGPLTDEQVRAVVAYLNASAGRSSPSLLAGAGKGVYKEQCAKCHGDKGDRVPVAPLSQKAFLDSRTDAQLIEAISEGVGVMPGFRQASKPILSEEQVKAAVAYLRYNVDALVAERVSRGRDLYLSNCLSCHGERGDRVASTNLASAEALKKLGDSSIATAIADGKGKMPGFGKSRGGTYGVEEVGALLAYLKSWAGLPADAALASPTPAAAGGASAGGGNLVALGKGIYTKTCVACHGEKGDKLPNAKLSDATFLQQQGDRALTLSIADGKGAMPAFGKEKGGPLSGDDVAALLAYLKSLAGIAPGASAAPPSSGAAPAAPAAAAPATPLAPVAPPSAEDKALIETGKSLYTKNCASCHGDGPEKMGRLADGTWLKQRGDTLLARTIAEGKSLPGSPNAMPAFGKEKGGPLGDGEIKAVLWFLKSIAGVPLNAPPEPAAGTGGAAVALGKEVFGKSCAACHGEKGDKLPNVKLNDPGWLKAQGDAALAKAIGDGKGAMPAFGKEKGGTLGAEEIKAVLDYLKSLAGG